MTHVLPIKVYYEDTDMGGVVYYANYLKFIERARSEIVEELGVDQNVMNEAGLVFVVTRVVADYLAPVNGFSKPRTLPFVCPQRGNLRGFQPKFGRDCRPDHKKSTRLPKEYGIEDVLIEPNKLGHRTEQAYGTRIHNVGAILARNDHGQAGDDHAGHCIDLVLGGDRR